MMFWLLLFQQPIEWSDLRQHLLATPEMRLVRNESEQAESYLRVSQANLHPQVSFSTSVNNTNQPVQVFGQKLAQQDFLIEDFARVGASGQLDPYPVNHPSNNIDVALLFQANYTIYDRARSANIDASVQRKAAAEARQALTWQQVLLEYAQQVIQLDALDQNLAQLDNMIQQTRQMEALLLQMFQEGQMPKMPYLEVQQSRLQLESKRADVAGNYAAQRASLQVWLQLPEQQTFPSLVKQPKATPGTHFQSQTLELQAQADRQNVETVQPAWKPTLQAFSQLEKHNDATVFYQVGLMASLKLWDGGQRKHQRAAKQLEASHSELQTEKANQSLRRGLVEVDQQIAAQEQSARLQQEALATVHQRWALEKQLLEDGQFERMKWIETQNQWVMAELELIQTQSKITGLSWQRAYLSGSDLEALIQVEN
ncbi:MAG: TolC family protein [Acidobacteria bacterium]|nr:TolC family protein [Acidobacteriota bacterium]